MFARGATMNKRLSLITFFAVPLALNLALEQPSWAVSCGCTYAYVTDQGSGGTGNVVFVVDTSTNTVIASLTVGAAPDTVAITPDAAHVYVGNTGAQTLSVVGTFTNKTTG